MTSPDQQPFLDPVAVQEVRTLLEERLHQMRSHGGRSVTLTAATMTHMVRLLTPGASPPGPASTRV